MKAIELPGYGGFESLRLIDTEKPKPTANEILIEVKAAGISFAELELTKGDYKVQKTPGLLWDSRRQESSRKLARKSGTLKSATESLPL